MAQKTKRKTRKTRKTRKIGGVNIHKLRSAIAESRTPTFSDKKELIKAVNGYCGELLRNKNEVVAKYGDIKHWNVSNITDMSDLFKYKQNFNEDISGWDVSNVKDMSYMFFGAWSFNQPLGSWDVSNVEDMSNMFASATSFNQPLGKTSNGPGWNVSNVKDMRHMFSRANEFNQPLDSWNVSNVEDMNYMFASATSFNQPLDSWNVSNVTNMSHMFSGANKFNQPLDSWNVSNVKNMSHMFYRANEFNQPLNSWNVSNVKNMNYMFFEATEFENDSYKKIALKLFTIPNEINKDMLEIMFKDSSMGNKILEQQQQIKRLQEFARASHLNPTLQKLQSEILSYIVGNEKASELTTLAAEKRKEIQAKYHSKLQKKETSQTL